MGHVLCIKQNNQFKKRDESFVHKNNMIYLLFKNNVLFGNLNHIECELNSTQTYSY